MALISREPHGQRHVFIGFLSQSPPSHPSAALWPRFSPLHPSGTRIAPALIANISDSRPDIPDAVERSGGVRKADIPRQRGIGIDVALIILLHLLSQTTGGGASMRCVILPIRFEMLAFAPLQRSIPNHLP